jgi:hypothetical protein
VISRIKIKNRFNVDQPSQAWSPPAAKILRNVTRLNMKRLSSQMKKIPFDLYYLLRFAGVHVLHENGFYGRRLSCSFGIGGNFILSPMQIIPPPSSFLTVSAKNFEYCLRKKFSPSHIRKQSRALNHKNKFKLFTIK